MAKLRNRVALVTGASRGIGKAAALALAQAGALVAVNYRQRGAEAQAVVAEIESHGGRAAALGPTFPFLLLSKACCNELDNSSAPSTSW